MASLIAVLVAVAGLLAGIVIGIFGAMGTLFGGVLLVAASVIFMVLPVL